MLTVHVRAGPVTWHGSFQGWASETLGQGRYQPLFLQARCDRDREVQCPPFEAAAA